MATVPKMLEAEENIERAYDASDIDQVKAARKTARRKVAKDREDYVSLMEQQNGRAFMWKFCAAAIDGDPVVNGDPYSTYFNLGQERKARALFKELLKVCPKLVAVMVEENMDKK